MNARPVLVALAALLLVVAGAFALLPFQAAEHDRHVRGALGVARTGNATADLDEPVAVYVEGPGWTAGAVGHFLVGDLRAAGVEATQVMELQDADGPILAVRVFAVNTSYWPVSPTATVEWRFVYSTSGNGSAVRDQLLTEGGPVAAGDERFVVEGQYTLTDDVRGVISIPAYRAAIADHVARTTAEKLQAAA